MNSTLPLVPPSERKLQDYEKLHILLDLETLATKPNAVITEIAAVVLENGTIYDSLIQPSSYPTMDSAFYIDPETVEWHDARRKSNYIEYLNLRGESFKEAAHEFVTWCERVSEGKQIVLWVHGTDFDVPILKNFLSYCGLETPWRYSDVKDFRTLSALFPEIAYKKGDHSALDDVVKMNQHFQKILVASSLVSQYVFGRD